MIEHRGADRRSMITGSSVHNQRIETIREAVAGSLVHYSCITDCFITWKINACWSLLIHNIYTPSILCSNHASINAWMSSAMGGISMVYGPNEPRLLTSFTLKGFCVYGIQAA